MNLSFRIELAKAYASPSQKIRILSEHWVGKEVYCPSCGRAEISRYQNNSPVADFFCNSCAEDYELKSQSKAFGSKVVDGAYRTMIQRLSENQNPNLLLLNYDLLSLRVTNLIVIPKYFFVPQVIERRPPLSLSARRAGWTGCNILLGQIPHAGRIYLIKQSIIEPREVVLSRWRRILFLRDQQDLGSKGWLVSVMKCIEEIGKRDFSLDELYLYEDRLRAVYPANAHIRAKIRQKLQVLRDKGYLEFLGRGAYGLAHADT
jgi:type II restriction enzyme